MLGRDGQAGSAGHVSRAAACVAPALQTQVHDVPHPCLETLPPPPSADNWTAQLREFLRDVVGLAPGERCYVAGNSLGGFLAVNLAAGDPDLVAGLALLNASE